MWAKGKRGGGGKGYAGEKDGYWGLWALGITSRWMVLHNNIFPKRAPRASNCFFSCGVCSQCLL